MGRLYRRGETWWADYRAPDGRRHRRSLNTADQKVARERLRHAELVATDPTAHRAARPLSAALDYLLTTALAGRPAATVSFYTQKARHLARLLGDPDVTEIDRAMVAEYANTRIHEGAHPSTVGKELITLRRALREEHERVPLPTNPRDIIPRWSVRYEPKDRHLSASEFHRVLEKAPTPRRLWLMIAAYTGANLSELERLDWQDVNLAAGVIRIKGRKRQGRFRLVPIAAPLRPWLVGARPESGRGVILGRWGNVRRELDRYADNARVPGFTPNDLRRTFGSWLKQAGVDSKAVADLMGHSSTRMVDLVYGKLTPATYKAAVANLPDLGGCDAGVPPDRSLSGRGGTLGTDRAALKTANRNENRVPRDGVEPPTRGFSVLASKRRKASR